MSDEGSDNRKPKGIDISKLGGEMSGEERAAANERMRERFKELTGDHAVMADALRGLGGASALQEDYMDNLIGAAGAAALAASGLQDRMRGLGIGENTSFSRIAAGIAEQQSTLDQLHHDRLEMAPVFRDIHISENPLIETNKRLERIEHRFDQISHVAETSAQTATELQLAAAEFLKDFKEAASKNDEAAADAIRLGKNAMWAAVLIPILVFVAQITANAYMPNREAEALQQTVIELQTEIDALQATGSAQTQRLINAIAASDEATAAAILEGLRELQTPAADAPPIAD